MSVATEETEERRTFKSRIGDGTSALIGINLLIMTLRFSSNLILTRFLAPEAFGVAAILTSISAFLDLATDMAVRVYLTRHPTADDVTIRTVWTVKFVRDLALAAMMFFGADIFADFYKSPQIADAIRVFSLIFVFGSIQSLSLVIAERQRRLLRLSLVNLACYLTSMTVTITLAVVFRSYWAIVIGIISGAALSLVLTHVLEPKTPLGFSFDRAALMEFFRFARVIIPSSIVTIVLTQIDRVYMARLFPIEELGFYAIALAISGAVTSLVLQYNNQAFFPLIARTIREDRQRLPSDYYRSRFRLTALLMFGLGGLIGGGELLAKLLFEDKYLRAGLYISIVAIAPLGIVLRQPAELTLIALGRVKMTLIGNLIRLGFLAVACPLAYIVFGPLSVIVAIVLSEAAPAPYFWLQLHGRKILDLRQEGMFLAAAGAGFMVATALSAAAFAMVAAGILPDF